MSLNLKNLTSFFTEINITIFSPIISLLSALYAYLSNRIAKRALKISEEEFRNKQPNFSVYLIECFRFKADAKTITSILAFHVTISNKSENKNSFKSLLEIKYFRPDNTILIVSQEHRSELAHLIQGVKVSYFENNINFEEKQSDSKYLIFEEPTIFDEYKIESFSIKIVDLSGNEKVVESHLMKDFNS